jgi:hypothetical protein
LYEVPKPDLSVRSIFGQSFVAPSRLPVLRTEYDDKNGTSQGDRDNPGVAAGLQPRFTEDEGDNGLKKRSEEVINIVSDDNFISRDI